MGVANRELDASEQREQLVNVDLQAASCVNGVTLMLGIIPYPATVAAIRVAGLGLSGAPTLAFTINRFIAGAGQTVITGGATTLTITAFGTSGLQSVVLAAAGSTLLNLLAGDVLQCVTGGGTGAAAVSYNIVVVTQATQDIKNHYSAF